jgi:hypothetical protein
MIDPEDSGQYTRIGHSGDSSIFDVYTSGASTANWTLTVDNGTTQNNIIVANYLGVALYYSNASVFEVTVRGCSVKDPAGGQSFLRHNNSTNVFEIIPYNANAGFTFFVTNGSYVAETAIKGNANGSVDFYYDNLLAAKTAAEGFSIYDTSGDDPTLWFIQDDGSTVNGFIEFHTTGFEITDSILSDIMVSSVSGIFSIYYLGTKTVDVTSESINLYSTDWPGVSTRAWGYLSHNGTVLRIDNQYTDGTVTISSRLGTIMTGSTASGVALYYATGNRFETKSGGVQIKGSAGNIYTISPTATETTLLSATTASHIVLSAGATAGGYNTMIDADPDGSVVLYYLGGKVLSTISSGNNGIEIIDTTGRQEWMYWNGNEFLLHTLAAAATLKIILRDGAGTNKTVAQMASTGPIFYGNNVKVLDMRASTDGGIRVYNSDGLSYTEVIHDGTDSIIRNRNNSNSVRLQADNSANTPKDLFVGNGDDSSGICYAGDITLGTAAGGVFIGDATLATSLSIVKSDPNITIKNNIGTGWIYLRGVNDSAAEAIMASFDPDAGCKLYYDNSLIIDIISSGFSMYDTSGQKANFNFNSTTLRVFSTVHGGNVEIRGENTSGTQTTMALFDPDGSVDIYHIGNKVFGTRLGGVQIFNGSNSMDMYMSPSDIVLLNNVNGGGIQLYARKAAGSIQSVLTGAADAATTIYHSGTSAVYTTAAGLVLRSSGTNVDFLEIQRNGDTIRFYGYQNGFPVEITSLNDSGVAKTLFKADPEGALEGYYAGTKTFESFNEGLVVDDVLKILERSSDPTQPAEGQTVMWMSDGTGIGDDGDVIVASQAGSNITYTIIHDNSGGTTWS